MPKRLLVDEDGDEEEGSKVVVREAPTQAQGLVSFILGDRGSSEAP